VWCIVVFMRTYLGTPIYTLSRADSRGRYAAYTPRGWVFGATLEGIKRALRSLDT
jgi:hypothetical protein